MQLFCRRRLSAFPPARPLPAKKDALTSLFLARVEEHPTKDVLNFIDDRKMSIGKLSWHSRAIANGLAMLSHGPTPQVLAVVPNNIERLVIQLACLYSGTKLAMVDEYQVSEIDMARLLHQAKPKSLFVSSQLVSKVRLAVPELTHAGFMAERGEHPRNHVGSMNDGYPISAQDFPDLKHCFHTGSGREGKFSRFRDLLVYYPKFDPLEFKPSLNEDDVFFTLLSAQGKLQKQVSINQILSEAKRVHQELRLGADEKLLLASGGDPLSTLVAVVAATGARAQVIIPGARSSSAEIAKAAALEQVSCALGNAIQVEQAGQRVAVV